MPTEDVLSTAEVAELRDLVVDLSFPDGYALERDATAPDGKGGRTATAQTVEAGACRLRWGGLRQGERLVFDKLGWATGYAVDLPPATNAQPSDCLVVNGRRFEIGEVLRGGAWALTATALCQERG